MSLKDRFESRAALVEALKAQEIIQGDAEIAAHLASAGQLVDFSAGQTLIEQSETDRDIYFLLAGSVSVTVNGSTVNSRGKHVAVGEMSAINPEIPRSATIQAKETTVAWKVTHEQLEAAATKAPRLWRLIAAELAARIDQRNKLILPPNERPFVFIISSAEALETAEEIRLGLEREVANVDLWSDEDIFAPGTYPLEALQSKVREADFGIAIAHPDDLVRSRNRESLAPRDNVIFELGYFMSKLGRRRTLLLVPGGEDVKLPSDFKGLAPMKYKTSSDASRLSADLAPTVIRIKKIIRQFGVHRPFEAH